jgi:WD40-like Beta Propeller Repeat
MLGLSAEKTYANPRPGADPARRIRVSAISALILSAVVGPAWAEADARVRNGLIAYTSTLDGCEGAVFECDGGVTFIRPDGRGQRRFVCSDPQNSECIETRPRFSPRGRLVATSDPSFRAGAEPVIAIRRLNGTLIRRIKLPGREGGADDIAWSADGTRLAFNDSERVFLVSSIGGRPRLFRTTGGIDIAWSRQGRLAWTHRDRVGVWVTDRSRRVVRRIRANVVEGPTRWSPDGRHLVSGGRVIRSDGSTLFDLKRCEPLEGAAAWSPDGRQIACGSVSGHLIAYQVRSRRVRVIRRNINVVDIDWQPRAF